jgi:O-antigen ligase
MRVQFMLMLLPFALSRAWNERSRLLRTAGWGSAAVILAGIALSGSRGATIGLAGMLLVMVGLGYARLRHAVALGLISASVLMVMPQYRERVASIVRVADVLRGSDVRRADTSVQGRLTEMAAAVLVFVENPLLGVGPGNFPAQFVEKADLLGFNVHGVERRAHCLYLEIAAETGVFGLVLLFAILGITIRNLHRAHTLAPSRRLQGETAAALAALVAMMVTGLFLSLAFVRYFWLIIGVCTAIARMVYLETSQDHRCVTADSCGSDAGRADHTEIGDGAALVAQQASTSC